MGISQADDLARVARISENFLVSGEAGIKNDFSAPAGRGSRGAAMKNAPIFERKNPFPCFRLGQWNLYSTNSPRGVATARYFRVSANTGIEPK